MAQPEVAPAPREAEVPAPGGTLPSSVRDALDATIHHLLAPGKGLLAADESMGTIGRRFERAGVRSAEESRRAYRELLFTAPGIGSLDVAQLLLARPRPVAPADLPLRPWWHD